MKKILFLSFFLFLCTLYSYSQELYQEGRGTHFDWIYFSTGGGTFSFFQAGVIFRHRLNDHFDVGLLTDFLTQSPDNSQNDFHQTAQGNSLTLGPVLGYTNIFSKSGWGVRSSLSLRMTFSSLSGVPSSTAMKLAGYGGDADVSVFKQIFLGKSVVIFPSIGIYVRMTYFTGHCQDSYGLSWIFLEESRERFRESPGTFANSGTLLQLPISFSFFGNKRLVITPAYYFNSIISRGTAAKLVGLFRFGLRLSF